MIPNFNISIPSGGYRPTGFIQVSNILPYNLIKIIRLKFEPVGQHGLFYAELLLTNSDNNLDNPNYQRPIRKFISFTCLDLANINLNKSVSFRQFNFPTTRYEFLYYYCHYANPFLDNRYIANIPTAFVALVLFYIEDNLSKLI